MLALKYKSKTSAFSFRIQILIIHSFIVGCFSVYSVILDSHPIYPVCAQCVHIYIYILKTLLCFIFLKSFIHFFQHLVCYCFFFLKKQPKEYHYNYFKCILCSFFLRPKKKKTTCALFFEFQHLYIVLGRNCRVTVDVLFELFENGVYVCAPFWSMICCVLGVSYFGCSPISIDDIPVALYLISTLSHNKEYAQLCHLHKS